MSKKVSLGAAVSIAAVASAITVSLTYVYAMDSFNKKVADVNARQAMYQKLSEIDQKARQNYVGTINEPVLTDAICAGYAAGLGDSHAQYLSAAKYREYLSASDSKSTGVGVHTVQDSDGNMEVIGVMPKSPAEKAGVKTGDVIVSLDGKEIQRITYGDALNRLSGTAGTKVTLGILRQAAGASSGPSSSPAQSLTLTVTRAEYEENMISCSMVSGNAGYLKISQFTDSVPQDFNEDLSNLVKQGAVGLVIDLRDNPGGKVESAASVLDTLLPAGNTVSYRDKNGKVTVECTSNSNEVNLPVSVIVNRETYGAAELFAADIRDFKKGLVVGERTAGYGVRDEAVPLSDGSAILLSGAEYLTAGGKTFNGAGVAPDIAKDLSDYQQSQLKRNLLVMRDDPQIQAAVTALVRQGAAVKEIPGTAQPGAAGDTD
jgi:carboxyl-terminal processing protease